jgi:hypothetical protein
MKKKAALVLLSLLCLSGIATAWTPFRFCFLPEVAIPVTPDVYGLNIGIFTGNGSYNQKVVGLDIGVVGSTTKMEGVQISLANMCQGSDSWQMAVLNASDDFDGVQIGGFNSVGEDSDSVQVGAINESSKSKSIQIGAINIMGVFGLFDTDPAKSTGECIQIGGICIMENGFLPVSLFLNFSVE